MSNSLKQQAGTPKRRRPERTQTTGVLKQFHCETISYEFEMPASSFDGKKFSKLTGIKVNDRWSAVLLPKNRFTGYHVHFSGLRGAKKIGIKIEYWEGSGKPAKDDVEPFAESVMRWVGSFVIDLSQISQRTLAMARFRKPCDAWRSRFNLPFKVRMADAEVVIDGVSLTFPKNQLRALSGFVAVDGNDIFASVQLFRAIDLLNFNVASEVETFNEAIKMFMEEKA